MKLSPTKSQEPVTILMIPLDQYSVFPKSVDAVFKETHYPFKLIVIEGNAPVKIRYELEERQKKNSNFKIIYSNHRPRMAEAFNLGLPHIRTSRAFFMHNNIRVTADWLSRLVTLTKHHTGVICPHISYAGNPFFQERVPETHEIDPRGFLITKELLKEIGEFDESVITPLLAMDLRNLFRTKNILVYRDPHTIMEHLTPGPLKGSDLQFFKHQWNDEHSHETLAYWSKKWSVALDERKYSDWLAKKGSSVAKKPVFFFPSGQPTTLIRIGEPKLDFKKFIEVLRRA
jgi:hypothetical protein